MKKSRFFLQKKSLFNKLRNQNIIFASFDKLQFEQFVGKTEFKRLFSASGQKKRVKKKRTNSTNCTILAVQLIFVVINVNY